MAHQIGCANKKGVGRVWGKILISCMKDHNPRCDFLVLEKSSVFFYDRWVLVLNVAKVGKINVDYLQRKLNFMIVEQKKRLIP